MMPYMQTLVYYCSGRPALRVFGASKCEQCLGLSLCCLLLSLGAPGARLFHRLPLFCAIREGRTETALSVAGCICASPWLPPLLSWSSLGGHPVAGYARAPGNNWGGVEVPGPGGVVDACGAGYALARVLI